MEGWKLNMGRRKLKMRGRVLNMGRRKLKMGVWILALITRHTRALGKISVITEAYQATLIK